ncbi:alpha/beta hydrolase [Myxococcus sp. AM009]|uniref:alpha/beta fold hydrolase n=1 Tax=unclassified Myxococcus TaxID=2648731 RepID=UPI001595CF61|nr:MULTISPECIES: alpha/beta hydrolase [unclassified Myxococcus]NVI99994.1 alpha/beta hydrolase [Myxococcus sp. AM009]NVJ15275.1 alpha/beta hydrolase [Myxococcus sp. AM010]
MREALQMEDWGGTGPVLHLAHANGFPPGCYRKLIEHLKPRYHVFTLRTRCLVPGSDPLELRTWDDMADDLIHALRAQGVQGIVGVGHSMGGVATLLASAKAPALFRAVVALDPVLFTGAREWALRALTLLGLRSRVPPASLARRRREAWGAREDAARSYAKKALFARFDPECFQDYITHGLTEAPGGGFRLTIPKAWEARVFETSPKDVWRELGTVSVPSLVIRGGESDTLTGDALERARLTLNDTQTEALSGTGHLLPLEQPERCAQRILAFLDGLESVRAVARAAR